MKALIVTNNQIGHNQYKIDRFIEESTKLDISFDIKINDGSLYYIENGEPVFNIGKYDFVIYLDKDIYTAYALEKAGYKLYNSADFIRLCDDKSLTFVKCLNSGIDMPKTITPPLVYSSKLDETLRDKFLTYVENTIPYPIIGKLSYSSLGEGVFKLYNVEQLTIFYNQHFNEPFVFQESVETSIGRSLRVLVINQEIVGAIERINESDFRSNASKSYSKKHQLDAKYLSFAKNIAEKLKIKYAGIDLLFGKDGPLLCEINSNAFFEEFEKTTNINVAYKFLSFIVQEVGKETK